MIRCTLGLAILMFLAGCGGWSKKKCAESNFEDIGYERGVQGLKSRGNQINTKCLEKEVSINLNSYNKGYQRGLKTYCTDEKAKEIGRLGQKPQSICTSIKHYMTGYDQGLRTFCTIERGAKDGYALKSKLEVCLAHSTYLIGYENGIKTYCSFEKGQEHGFSGTIMHEKCSNHSTYNSGYKKGSSNFCMPENGQRLGEKGAEFPEKCTKPSFKAAYNKGRSLFIKQRIKDLNINLDVEKKNYKNIKNELQDAQFTLQNLSQKSRKLITKEQKQQRRKLPSRIRKLKRDRNKQHEKVTDIEFKLRTLRSDLENL